MSYNSTVPSGKKKFELKPGTLYLVATPIGNLGDITYRAVETLAQVDFILCEDTRKAGKMLEHYGVKRELSSFHMFNEAQKLPWVIKRLEEGATIALISNAGTPLVCDPGSRLVKTCIMAGIGIELIPGPTAFTTAMVLSGFFDRGFHFTGWIPRKGKERDTAIHYLATIREPLIFYESPNRVAAALADFAKLQPDREAVVARELTKLHEEVIRGTCASLAAELKDRQLKGECVIVLGPLGEDSAFDRGKSDMVYNYFALLKREGIPPGRAAKTAARLLDLPVRDVYRLLMIDEVESC
jgi:16S rRNA (cytidine1402-2'-O)-methyltransferase